MGKANEERWAMKLFYLKPKQSFSYLAAKKHYKHLELVGKEEMVGVLEAVEKGEGLGIIPISNTTTGLFEYILQKTFEYSVAIETLVEYGIDLNLVSNTPISSIKRIYSHPKAFLQTKAWISTHLPTVALYNTKSTSDAVSSIKEQKGVGAIGSLEAAEMYGVPIAAHNIQDNKNNKTTFIIIKEEL